MPYKNKEKQKEWARQYYAKNEERKENVRLTGLKRHREIREWMTEYKSNLKCEKCPEDHSACMDFHHEDPGKKEITIAKAIQHRWSRKRILKEIEKCIVLCANCHRKLHASVTQYG